MATGRHGVSLLSNGPRIKSPGGAHGKRRQDREMDRVPCRCVGRWVSHEKKVFVIIETAEWTIGGEGKKRPNVVLLLLKEAERAWPWSRPHRRESPFAFSDAFTTVPGPAALRGRYLPEGHFVEIRDGASGCVRESENL